MNFPDRSLEKLSVETFKGILDVNLNGPFYFVHAALPVMRKQGGGTILNARPHPAPRVLQEDLGSGAVVSSVKLVLQVEWRVHGAF